MTTLRQSTTKVWQVIAEEKEAAEELNISQATLDRLRKNGDIVSKRVRRWSFLHYP
ncbi:MAG: hypothetical protein Q9M43_15855 [Sulfurimonas sp.]|nr:hypothetical protein [Sulfurimonas sp.]